LRIPIITDLLEARNSLAKWDAFMDSLIDGNTSSTGVQVNESTALHNTAVMACVRILAETVASLPLPVYRRLQPRGKERATDHELYKLLHDAPNPYMTSFTFREVLMGHLATWGNAYAEIEWTGMGQVKSLTPLRPDRMKDIKRASNGRLVYIYRLPDGTDKVLLAYQVLHIPGLGYDGVVGYSPIAMAREAIGLAMATEKYGSKFFGNNARPGGVLEHPNKLSEPASKNLRASWNEMHQGLNNSHRIAILEEGMTYKQIGIPPEDAQFLETRKFQLQEIARIYRIPPHMLADLERATFSNIEHQSIDFVVHTVRPWLVRWEQAMKQKLFTGESQEAYYAEFLVDGLLRGDTQTRYQAYAIGRQWGWFSANDVREIENLNPLEGTQGDIYMVPMNMMDASQPAIQPAEARTEQRSVRAALDRRTLAQRHEALFQDAATRIVKREVKDIKRAVKSHLRDSRDFGGYLDEYYAKAPTWIRQTMMPVFVSLAEMTKAQASAEVDYDGDVDVGEFVNDYAETFAARYAGSSRGQLLALVRDTPLEEVGAAIDERLDEWEERRPNKVAMNETIRQSNAVARFVFAAAGITKLIWRNTGSKTCEFCEGLNGKVVGIEQPFLSAGDNLEGVDGKGNRLSISGPKMHPPIHAGCQCTIEPGR
jgi:HK97 family phage portal protein